MSDCSEMDDSYHIEGAESNSSTTEREESTSRDEVQEIRKMSQKETTRVHIWRGCVTLALLATAVAVTATTYKLLMEQEDKNFRNVYSQFARTVADSAIDQQKDLRNALRSLSDTVSLSAEISGSPWPFFFPPKFEAYAKDFKILSRAEFVGVNNLVRHDDRDKFVNFTTSVYQDVVKEAHMINVGNLSLLEDDTTKYNPYITQKTADGFVEDEERDLYFVRTIQSPPPRKYGPQINWNLASDEGLNENYMATLTVRDEVTITKIRPFLGLPDDEHQGFHANDGEDNPHSFAHFPIFKETGNPSSTIVAVFSAAIAWDASMRNLLPDNVHGMLAVVKNTCGQVVSYRIEGREAYYQGDSDVHLDEYSDLAVNVDLALNRSEFFTSTPGHCMYTMTIYPTRDFEDDYKTKTPLIFAIVVASTFVMVALTYFAYDIMVQKRNELMVSNAAKSNAIVSDLLPDHLRDRLMQQKEEAQMAKKNRNLKAFLNDGKEDKLKSQGLASKPLADLFLDTTVLFADICGFTAWSSVREPTQVFTLLESVYSAFDHIAKKRRIFKVETVGDCYVAVAGLPEPRKDHPIAMARFARDMLSRMSVLTRELEVILGPDTGDLALRIGIHSGPVTAGVLRGERSRFQLFGDTMNTTARMENSSYPGRIQTSKETADLLKAMGKGAWLEKRMDLVVAKGKGELSTYWLNVGGDRAGSVVSASQSSGENLFALKPIAASSCSKQVPGLDDRTYRLVEWNVESLCKIMREIVAHRNAKKTSKPSTKKRNSVAHNGMGQLGTETPTTPLEEVQEIIALPEFDASAAKKQVNPESVKISDVVVSELHRYVSVVASLYQANPFHNFDHASHVVMSVTKLLSRIHTPKELEEMEDMDEEEKVAASLHDYTFGITSDPLTQFACAFSALIHDIDHQGVSNAQLVKEGVEIATLYKGRSVAEQNSLDLAWDLLMGADFYNLRNLLFPTESELTRFRQLVVNSVMSTDIVDKELKELRNARWEKAFKTGDNTYTDENPRDEVNRKATIVIEHIIQASDISHTMQHWHVYRKWNQNLFEELYVAYLNGRMDKDPADFWYKGEFGFFDFYIIPLTKKLKECGVFGVSSDEYLNYAINNRREWESKGEQVVAELVQFVREKHGVKLPDGRIVKEGDEQYNDAGTGAGTDC